MKSCAACRACGHLDEPRVDASPVKDVAASGELSAPLAVSEAVQTDNAMGIGSNCGSLGDPEVGELVDVARVEGAGGGGGGAEAKAVEGTAYEEEVEEEEGGEAKEEEEEGGEEEHDDGFEEEGKEIRVWFWLGIGMVLILIRRRHGGD
ncbi:hypothetical protein SESBI_06075 [Sesbania bispinosa]|nr:hypothetical protein SESBI_06075 [Sesbania bispinosa]